MARESTFNPEHQASNTASKIVVAFERLSEAFRVLMWNEAKQHGISSTIQIQLLTFLLHYPKDKKTVTNLAEHFNLTKATISDAVKTLEQKGFVQRKVLLNDTRSHTLVLTKEGKQIAQKVERFAQPIQHSVGSIAATKQAELLEQLLGIIHGLNDQQVLNTQHMCFNCNSYEKKGKNHYCEFVSKTLKPQDLRVECPDFVEA
ncbi:DNA-binding MarR family transcriptional regulator [Chitinophaga skermanii]|uniref:DNA-binding MarR family transcriptional regulator n=1 Tax=Chitinophaga skermanii TaxID=331697 RepID=A0A327QCK1_9BACT|nr:MarR family winged helix-turn-helix transcriptional regulator [Chitinophaga skermanii]RAJ01715.1 DNA-binding MarR family transcriptional regulator [Chitinophaga skermanii]